VRSYRFYAVFIDDEEFSVKEGSEEIGSIAFPPPCGERFGLAGRTWEVEDVDLRRKIVFVRSVEGKALTSWPGPSGIIHTRIKEKMREVLLEDTDYPYLQTRAKERLHEARRLARSCGLQNNHIFHLGGETYAIFPWLGTRSFRTLKRVLGKLSTELGIKSVEGEPSNYLLLKMEKGTKETLLERLKSLAQTPLSSEGLVGGSEAPLMEKFDPYIPARLLRKAYAYDHLDLEEFLAKISQW